MHFKKIVEICEDYPHQGLSRRMAGQEDFRISTIVRPGLIRRGVSLWVAAVIMMRLKGRNHIISNYYDCQGGSYRTML